MSPARIAVVEDDHALRNDLVDFLNLRGFEAVGAASAMQLWALLDKGPVELVLLDIGLPDQSGLAVAPLLCVRHPGVGIVMLTAFSEDQARVDGLSGGADAYLVKNTSLEVIEATCRSVLRRLEATPVTPPPEPTQNSAPKPTGWQLRTADCMLAGPNGKTAMLTLMELGFLQAVMAKPGQTLTREALLSAMGKVDTLSNLRNLDGCAARLRRKAVAAIGLELPLRSFYARGYVFTGDAFASEPVAS